MLAGHVPVRGEVIQGSDGFEYEVLDADPRRVKKLRISWRDPAPLLRPQTAPRHCVRSSETRSPAVTSLPAPQEQTLASRNAQKNNVA